MLFTDARPNVGATGEGEFTDLVSANADQVGLTAFGVGLDFGQELTLTISRIRGGNFVFLRDADAIRKAFDEELDFLVTPVAYDLKLDVTPGEGLSLVAAHGVSSWEPGDANVTIEVGTLFLSRRRGAIVARLKGEPVPGAPILSAALSFTEGENVVETTLSVDFGEDSGLEEGATWYSQPGVRKTVALTNVALGAFRACELWWNNARDDALLLARTVRDRLVVEAGELEDETLAEETAFAGKLVAVMEEELGLSEVVPPVD